MNRGAEAEQLVADALKEKGWAIAARNYHSRYGEIDVIADNGCILAFVEVRCRAADGLVHPLETVTRTKQRRILQTAQCFLQQYPYPDRQPRFDVAAVCAQRGTLRPEDIQYIENAFGI